MTPFEMKQSINSAQIGGLISDSDRRVKMEFVKRTWAEISLDAIAHNYNVIKNKINGKAKICCVIKADG